MMHVLYLNKEKTELTFINPKPGLKRGAEKPEQHALLAAMLDADNQETLIAALESFRDNQHVTHNNDPQDRSNTYTFSEEQQTFSVKFYKSWSDYRKANPGPVAPFSSTLSAIRNRLPHDRSKTADEMLAVLQPAQRSGCTIM
jgi:hypothetical protein